MSNIVNLDEIIPGNLIVKIKGKDIVIPLDVPVEETLKLLSISAKMFDAKGTNPTAVMNVFSEFLDVTLSLIDRNKTDEEINKDWMLKNCTLHQSMKFADTLTSLLTTRKEDEENPTQ